MAIRLITIIALSAFAPALWADAYYWVDENGKRHYSDRVPPKESKRERKVIDERGFTVKTLPKEMTEAERKEKINAQTTAKREKEQASRERAEQIAYDNLLLTTYEDVSDLELARDDRLGLLDASILVEVQAHADNTRRLSTLRLRETKLLEAGNPIPNNLKKSINNAASRIATNEANIVELKKQRDDIEAKYNRDISRYSELKLASED